MNCGWYHSSHCHVLYALTQECSVCDNLQTEIVTVTECAVQLEMNVAVVHTMMTIKMMPCDMEQNETMMIEDRGCMNEVDVAAVLSVVILMVQRQLL